MSSSSYKALGPIKNRLFIDGSEMDVFGKTVNISRSDMYALETIDSGFGENIIQVTCVEFNDVLHFFGSFYAQDSLVGVHKSFDGETWTTYDTSALPLNKNSRLSFAGSTAVVYNNEIHLLGCQFKNIKEKVWH